MPSAHSPTTREETSEPLAEAEVPTPDAAPSVVRASIVKTDGTRATSATDNLAIEEPLEIRLAFTLDGKRTQQTISVTMRTPGHDFELACGLLLSEGIIRSAGDVAKVAHCGPAVGDPALRKVVRVTLAPHITPDLRGLDRHSFTSSACGVCGKTSMEALQTKPGMTAPRDTAQIDVRLLYSLPATLRAEQAVFERTGGLHAAALFDLSGQLLSLREDVGRHNALDKLIGAELLASRLPLTESRILLLSGRASFELLQKAATAGIPTVAAIGAPSSLAVDLAKHYGITLIGFLRNDHCNVYSDSARLQILAVK
jgi:FdhD protein